MMKRNIFLFLIAFKLSAQLNFYKAYIVTLKGDTIYGEIKANPKKELSLFSKVMFKDDQGTTKTYKPDKILAFGYTISEKNSWKRFIAIQQSEPCFYKIAIQHPVVIYEYQYEDMKVGGDFYTAKEYYLKHNDDYIKLKSKKLKKQLSEYIDNPDVLNELDKMNEIDIDKLASLIEKHYPKDTL